jgi:hypothetical protein
MNYIPSNKLDPKTRLRNPLISKIPVNGIVS